MANFDSRVECVMLSIIYCKYNYNCCWYLQNCVVNCCCNVTDHQWFYCNRYWFFVFAAYRMAVALGNRQLAANSIFSG